MKLIVGLGNPGKEYENTRHNVGFIVVDNYTRDLVWSVEKNYMITSTAINGEKIIFLKPLTYMNLSGYAVSQVVNYYKISTDDVLVIHDDLDLPIGEIKLKFNSSAGGHNGIKSIIEQLGTMKFSRLKIGIGKNDKINTCDYVLNKLSTEEKQNLSKEIFNDIINCYIKEGIERAMNIYNTKG